MRMWLNVEENMILAEAVMIVEGIWLCSGITRHSLMQHKFSGERS